MRLRRATPAAATAAAVGPILCAGHVVNRPNVYISDKHMDGEIKNICADVGKQWAPTQTVPRAFDRLGTGLLSIDSALYLQVT